MDVFTDPAPETYLKWKRFTMPDTSGGKTAVAMSTTHAGMFTALYTLLIVGIFSVGWNVLLSIVLLLFHPRKMTRTTYIAVVAAWNANDPLYASTLMLKHTFRVLCGAIQKSYPEELNWRAFSFDLAILIAALGTLAGSLTVGIIFPDLLIIGSAAPVNAGVVYYPTYDDAKSAVTRFKKLEYSSMGALRAVGSIEGSEVTVRKRVRLARSELPPVNRETRYNITYHYRVTGIDIGLQYLGKLALDVEGLCAFQDDWYTGQALMPNTTRKFDMYTLWPNSTSYPDISPENNIPIGVEVFPNVGPYAIFRPVEYQQHLQNHNSGRSYYTILPATAGRVSMSEGIDAWYATIPRVEDNSNFKFEVKRGRPPLICQQDDKWSYGSWTGTMKNLLSNETDGPPFSLRLGIRRILQSEFAFPMIVNIGQSLNAGALKSATRLLQGDNALDANAAKAEFDMLRLVLAAFIATRDVFRDAAMAGPALGKENRGNALDAPDGTKIEGTADFVMVSSVVSTLRFGYLLAIPLTLILLLLLSSLFNATRRVKALKTNGGRLGRFVKFVIDLQAAQLYRKVDEILAGMKFPDGEKDPTLELPEWKNKTSSLPYVRPRSATSRPSMERLVHPQMQEANTALLKMVDPNSDPKATDKHPEPYLAVGHAPQPEGEFQDGGSECKQGKDNSEESSIEGTGEDEAGNHGEAIIPWTVLE